jgi:2-haloalkanoic acid dehalogenase type II
MTRTKPKAIIFDCWNTLFYVHTSRTTFTRLAQALLHQDITYPLVKRIESSLQKAPEADSKAAARKLLKDLHLPRTSLLVNRTEKILLSPMQNHYPYEDSLQVLDELRQRGYKLGMLSNTYQVSFEYLIDEFDLKRRFNVVMPSYTVGMIKPDPKLFDLMRKSLGVSKGEVVMVGDSYRDDILGAEAAGIRAILVDRRNRRPQRKERVESLTELLKQF